MGSAAFEVCVSPLQTDVMYAGSSKLLIIFQVTYEYTRETAATAGCGAGTFSLEHLLTILHPLWPVIAASLPT